MSFFFSLTLFPMDHPQHYAPSYHPPPEVKQGHRHMSFFFSFPLFSPDSGSVVDVRLGDIGELPALFPTPLRREALGPFNDPPLEGRAQGLLYFPFFPPPPLFSGV